MMTKPLFQGLIVNEQNVTVEVTYIGKEAHYVINDNDFLHHVSAVKLDEKILKKLRNQIMDNKDTVSESAMQMTGKNDLFTKAMIDSSLKNIDTHIQQLLEKGLPDEAQQWLSMLGFHIVVDHHGDVISISQPDRIDPNT